jgi:hypothetical protein
MAFQAEQMIANRSTTTPTTFMEFDKRPTLLVLAKIDY